MARRKRTDEPGLWHHVMNRGLAKRPLFESRTDMRYFLACLARSVRRGELEVHAFCLLPTHFHLLVASPNAELSQAMQRIQNDYVRAFNRRVGRDGPLMRGRFLSKPARTEHYREKLVRYIDQNPVRARIVTAPWKYEYGSARAFRESQGPIWLTRTWVERTVRDKLKTGSFSGQLYEQYCRNALPEADRLQIDAWPHQEPTEAEDLIGATPERVREWFERKARLGDGTKPGSPLAGPDQIERVIDWRGRTEGALRLKSGTRLRDAWPVLRVGLLRDLAGMSFPSMAGRVRGSTTAVARTYRLHQAWTRDEPTYRELVTQLGNLLLDR